MCIGCFGLARGQYTLDFGQLIRFIYTGEITAHLYFIIAIIQLYLITPVLKKIIENNNKKVVIILCGIITIMTVVFLYKYSFYNRIFTRYLFCYILGCYAGKNYDIFINILRKYKIPIYCTYIVALFFELSSSYLFAYQNLPAIIQQLVTMTYMPIAVIFIYSLSLNIVDKFHISKQGIINIINKNSYFIYLYHILTIWIADIILSKISITNIWIALLTRILITTVILCICFLLKRMYRDVFKRRNN